MKNIISVFTLLFCPFPIFGDSFYEYKEGKRYLCQLDQTPQQPCQYIAGAVYCPNAGETCSYIAGHVYCGYSCEYIAGHVYCAEKGGSCSYISGQVYCSQAGQECEYINGRVYCGVNCDYIAGGVHCSQGGLAPVAKPAQPAKPH